MRFVIQKKKKKNAIPKEKWVLMKHPILVTGIDGGNSEIGFWFFKVRQNMYKF